MNRMVEWFARNGVAANLLAAFIIVSGLLAIPKIKQEIFPEFSSDWVMVQMIYPGAAPKEVEKAICVKIEDAVQGLQGVEQTVSNASEGIGVVTIELLPHMKCYHLVTNHQYVQIYIRVYTCRFLVSKVNQYRF